MCVVRRRAAMLPPAPWHLLVPVDCPVWSRDWDLSSSDWDPRRLEPSRATKSGGKAQGVGFQGPPEEATMAGQPFQEHLKGSYIQDLLCRGEAPDLVS